MSEVKPIAYNSKPLNVNIKKLIETSKKIERIAKRSRKEDEISIDSPFPTDAFEAFAQFSCEEEPDFKVQNVFKVFCAADFFENSALKAKAMNYIKTKVNFPFTTTTFIDYMHENRPYLAPFYEIFATDLPKYLEVKEFCEIPISHLTKIFHHPLVTSHDPSKETDFVVNHIKNTKTAEAIKMVDFTTLSDHYTKKIVSALEENGFVGQAYMIFNIMKMKESLKDSPEVVQNFHIEKKFEGKYFDGVFTSLKERMKVRNLVSEGVINFQASSNSPINIVNYSSKVKCTTDDREGSFIMFSLPHHSVKVTGYRICSSNTCMPLGWVLEGSTDGGLTWYEIDKKTDCEDIKEPHQDKFYKIDSSYYESFNVIRITQTQKNSEGDYSFCLQHFDVFGQLLPTNEDYSYNEAIKFADGILATLADREELIATMSSNSPHLLFDYSVSDIWESSSNDSDPYFIIDLKNRSVKPTGYTIRSPYRKENTCQPLTWEFSAGNSLDVMTIIHRTNKLNDINGPGIFKYYKVDTVPHEPCRYLMFKMTGLNSGKNKNLSLDSIEVFGDLFESLGDEECIN